MEITFYPKLETVLYVYKKMQPAFSKKGSAHEVNVKFMKLNGFESLKKLENVLLVFDDSCGDIYNDKDIVRLATAVWYGGIDVKYVKHNLVQQTRWLLTIDLNTSHIIQFKSSRDVQQRFLNVPKNLSSCYELATRDSFGHLLIDLPPAHQIVWDIVQISHGLRQQFFPLP